MAVTGSIQTRTYEAQDGSKRSAFDIVADEVEFLPSANRLTAPLPAIITKPLPPPPPRRAHRLRPMPRRCGFTQVDDDELPF